jgi:hypothetical protein
MKFRFDLEGTAERNFWLLDVTGDELFSIFRRKFGDLPVTIMAVSVTTGRQIRNSLLRGMPKQNGPRKAKRPDIRFKIEIEGTAEESLRGIVGWEGQTGQDLFGIFWGRFTDLPISIHAVQVTTGGFINHTILSGFPEHEAELQEKLLEEGLLEKPAPVKFQEATC